MAQCKALTGSAVKGLEELFSDSSLRQRGRKVSNIAMTDRLALCVDTVVITVPLAMCSDAVPP